MIAREKIVGDKDVRCDTSDLVGKCITLWQSA